MRGATNLVSCRNIYSGTTWYDILLFIDVNISHDNRVLIGAHSKTFLPGGHGIHSASSAVLYKNLSRCGKNVPVGQGDL